MKRFLLSSLILFVFTAASLYSQETGSQSTDNKNYDDCFLSRPVFSDSYPKLNASAMFIPLSTELTDFFSDAGIEIDDLTGKAISSELIEKICSLCKEREEDFCKMLHSLTRKYMTPLHSAYVVKLGNLFWTIYS